MHIRIFNHYLQSSYVLLSIVEFLVLVFCSYAVLSPVALSEQLGDGLLDLVSVQYSLIYAVVMMLSSYSMGVYGAGVTEGFWSMLARSIVSYCLLGGMVMVAMAYVLPSMYVGQKLLFVIVCLSLILVLIMRVAFYSLVDLNRLKARILVLGAGDRALGVQKYYESGAFSGCLIVGFVCAGDKSRNIIDHNLVSGDQSLEKITTSFQVDEIVVAVDERRKDRGSLFSVDQLLNCKLTGIRVTELVEFYERQLARIDISEVSAGWMVFGQQFRYRQFRDVIKRSMDIILSLMLIILAGPLMLLTAIAVYIDTGMPIIYKQYRVGYNGKIFEIYKFRSMCQEAEKDGTAVWASKNDSRVTRVGAFIRNTRLDELPQVLNVLKGDMSFVGPRPERPEFVSKLSTELPYYDLRHQVKPGLMGWAQLKYAYGASVEDAANKLMYDLYYLKNHGLLLDLSIILQSVEVILLGKGVR